MVEGEADKMTEAATRMKENKKSGRVEDGAVEDPNDPYQIAQYYTDAFLEDARKLGYKIAFEYPEKVPHATQFVTGEGGMQEMIQRLLERGHAYVSDDGVVYYSVESFPGYGQLSGNTLDKLQSGAGGRVSEENQSRKRHPADFMLWKPDEHHIMKWDSPWGTGYPGWHIECSVMARKLLGRDVIDIHTGGEDLIFPHHECEIAQTCGATGKESFARFWIHARFLQVDGEKMSKSKGNFYTARDLFTGNWKGKTPVHPSVVRYELIKSHYRDNMNFTTKGISDSANAVRRMIDFRQVLDERTGGEAAEVDLNHPVLKQFAEQLANDLNIAGALGVVHPWIRGDHPDPHESLAVWRKINSVLSIAPTNEGIEGAEKWAVSDGGDDDDKLEQAEKLCAEMTIARKEKDWTKSDELRDKIIELGFEVQQTKEGCFIKKELA